MRPLVLMIQKNRKKMSKDKKLGETLLISEELLKLYSPISNNVGVDKIFPFVHLAQSYYVEPILGKAMMEQLQSEIDADALSDENKALIIKIAPCLAFYTSYLAARSLTYTISEKGMTLESSENSRSISERELGEYILTLKNQSEMYAELLVKYLCNCQHLYELWRPETPCECNKYIPTDGTTETTRKYLAYFPNKRKKTCCNN